MTFRASAPIDLNQHKGIVGLNSITGNAIALTGLSLTNAQPLHTAIVDQVGSQLGISTNAIYVQGSITPSGTQDVNITKVGGSSFALGQQLATASLPIVLTAAQISTLTPIPTAGTLIAFVTSIPNAGTRVNLASNALTQGVVVQAPSTNSGVIYVGGSGVSSSVYGAELQPGQSTGVAVNNTNLIWVDTAVNSNKVAVIGG